jgi:hypothetical protein
VSEPDGSRLRWRVSQALLRSRQSRQVLVRAAYIGGSQLHATAEVFPRPARLEQGAFGSPYHRAASAPHSAWPSMPADFQIKLRRAGSSQDGAISRQSFGSQPVRRRREKLILRCSDYLSFRWYRLPWMVACAGSMVASTGPCGGVPTLGTLVTRRSQGPGRRCPRVIL